MKIGITGANGFVGKYLVNYFSKENEIVSFSRQDLENKKNITHYKWDLNYEFPYDFEKPLEFDVFIHAASDTGYEKNEKEMIKNNVLSNKNIIDFLKNNACKHFIYVSSSSVYMGLEGEISEDIKIEEKNLVNSYALTKYLAEKYLIENLPKNTKLTILRPRAIYGIGDRVLEPNILKYQIFKRLVLIGNGKNVTSLTDVNYFVEICEKVIKNQKTDFEIFNVSDEKTKNMESIYKELVNKYGLKGIIKIPLFIFKILYFLNKNKISYLIDSFGKDKILNTEKIDNMIK